MLSLVLENDVSLRGVYLTRSVIDGELDLAGDEATLLRFHGGVTYVGRLDRTDDHVIGQATIETLTVDCPVTDPLADDTSRRRVNAGSFSQLRIALFRLDCQVAGADRVHGRNRVNEGHCDRIAGDCLSLFDLD